MTERLEARSARIERSLERTLSSPHADVEFDSIRDRWPSGYVRGQLFLALVDAVGTDVADPFPAAVSLELSYLQALVHGRILEDVSPTGRTAREDDRAILSGDYLQARAFERLGRLDAPAPLVTRCFSVLTRASIRTHEGQFEARQFSGDTSPADAGVVRFDHTAPAVLGGAAARLAGVLGELDEATLSSLEEGGAAFGWTLATEAITGNAAIARPRESLDRIIGGIVDSCQTAAAPGLHRNLRRIADSVCEERDPVTPSGRP
ncbi:Geranylgeranyl pyrophosphate synthase [Halalkaliarchaeum sp. AArc-CO]|uniref:polyprenyl synthetase family protein n=1 Tax=unclassified Halalkaliarchaeum TaxID=2678344 RepID=UPI00217ED0F0|nr:MULTISPECIES: polyprenyl synthetase family protein [unclassified Halalkaliarchaeum]MDR5674461.1 polyprenyl synthetase family protein [Halalkaliarchaeum sp. AArc-GB]UWG51910.1 Geranylgeranyl pyrophosphate synthase [Halalkaliarchaeum sp. AArc-CO]